MAGQCNEESQKVSNPGARASGATAWAGFQGSQRPGQLSAPEAKKTTATRTAGGVTLYQNNQNKNTHCTHQGGTNVLQADPVRLAARLPCRLFCAYAKVGAADTAAEAVRVFAAHEQIIHPFFR